MVWDSFGKDLNLFLRRKYNILEGTKHSALVRTWPWWGTGSSLSHSWVNTALPPSGAFGILNSLPMDAPGAAFRVAAAVATTKCTCISKSIYWNGHTGLQQ